jgi:hypothetical protein
VSRLTTSIAMARRLIVGALHDLWLLPRRDLAAPLERNPEVISHWRTRARTLRDADTTFARRQDDLRTQLVARYGDDDVDP